MDTPTDPLIAELRSPACRPLLRRLTKKRSRGEPFTGSIRLAGLDPVERAAIAALTGSRSRSPNLTIDLNLFDQVVRNTGRFESAAELIDQAAGRSLADERARRERHAAEWREVWQELIRRLGHDPALSECVSDIRRRGWLSRISRRDPARARDLLLQAIELLEKLPAPPTPLAVFAARELGDAHGLDSHQPVARLLARLISAREGLPPPTRSELRRRVWESVGLVSDELSSTVLCLNLPAHGSGLTDQMLRQHAAHGMPCRISFRHLRIFPVTFTPPVTPQSPATPRSPDTATPTDTAKPAASIRSHRNTHYQSNFHTLYVCENPSVLAAASESLGANCPPLVCVEGNPSLACVHLLKLAAAAGARVHYHGDFDWGGLRIANRIYHQVGFTPWRYSAVDYDPHGPGHRSLKPPVARADWDETLGHKIEAGGVAVEEESVLQQLLNDLQESTR